MKFFFKLLIPVSLSAYSLIITGIQLHASTFQYLLLGIAFLLLTYFGWNSLYEKYLKKQGLHKKRATISIVVAIPLILLCSNYFIPGSIASTQFANLSIIATGEKNALSSGNEVWILEVQNDGRIYDSSKISLKNSWERRGKDILSYKDQPAELNIQVENPSNPKITFLKHPWSGKVQIKTATGVDTIDLYQAGAATRYEYQVKDPVLVNNGPSFFVRLLFLGLVLLCIAPLIYSLLTILQKPDLFFIYNILLWFILFRMQDFLSFSRKENLLMLILSILTAILTARALKTAYFQNNFKQKDLLVLSLISLYASFVCTGNTLFLESNTNIITAQKISFFVLFALWFLPVEISFLYITYALNRLAKQQRTGSTVASTNRFKKINLWALFFFVLTATWSVYLYAFSPGLMSRDSFYQWGQAIRDSLLHDWHPVFHTLSIRYLIGIYYSPATVALAQILFLASVVAGFLVFLYKRGIPEKWLYLFVCLFAIIPVHSILVITLWKDIPFTISLLWLTLILANLVTDPLYFKRKIHLVELTSVLIMIALFRHNGLVVYGVALLVLLIYFFRHQNIKAIPICLSVSLIAIISYKVIVSNQADILQIAPAVKTLPPIHAIAAVIKNDGQLPPDIQKCMDTILTRHEWDSLYSPYYADTYLYYKKGAFIEKVSAIPTGKVLKMYGAALINHPYFVIRDRLQGLDYLWNLTRPVNAYNYRYITENEQDAWGFTQKKSKLRTFLTNYLDFTLDKAEIFLWRVGLYNIFTALLLFFALRNGPNRNAILFLPWAGSILSLIPAMAYQDYRYVWFIFLLFGFLWLLIISNVIILKITLKAEALAVEHVQ